MAVPVHLFLTNDGGTMICGSCDVAQREGSIELRGLQHNLSLPTDSATGKVTGTRQHSPFQFTKELDSSSPYLFKAAATGQTLKTAEFRFYHINYSGQEEEYYRITLENVKVISNVNLLPVAVSLLRPDLFPSSQGHAGDSVRFPRVG